MKSITVNDIPDAFPIGEAYIDCYYGKIRAGKTYNGTALVWELLKAGNVVYTSWPIEFDGYDQRQHWIWRFLHAIGLKRSFLVVPKENLHFVDIMHMNMDVFFQWFGTRTDCVLVIDEAQKPFDSYVKTFLEKAHRMSIFATGHFNRALILLVQRPMQLHIAVRSQIQRWFKIEKDSGMFGTTFTITEFQQTMTDGLPDETPVMELNPDTNQMEETGQYKYAESQRNVSFRKKIARSYDSKYLRGGMAPSQKNHAQVIHIPWLQRITKSYTIRSKVEQ